LLLLGLIIGLLPGFAYAQMQPDIKGRASGLVEQFRNTSCQKLIQEALVRYLKSIDLNSYNGF